MVLRISYLPCRVKATFEVVGDNVRRAAASVDSRLDVSGKAAKAAQGVREQAEAVNDRLGLKRKLRTAAEDVRRKAPAVRRRMQVSGVLTYVHAQCIEAGPAAGVRAVAAPVCAVLAHGAGPADLLRRAGLPGVHRHPVPAAQSAVHPVVARAAAHPALCQLPQQEGAPCHAYLACLLWYTLVEPLWKFYGLESVQRTVQGYHACTWELVPLLVSD